MRLLGLYSSMRMMRSAASVDTPGACSSSLCSGLSFSCQPVKRLDAGSKPLGGTVLVDTGEAGRTCWKKMTQ